MKTGMVVKGSMIPKRTPISVCLSYRSTEFHLSRLSPENQPKMLVPIVVDQNHFRYLLDSTL